MVDTNQTAYKFHSIQVVYGQYSWALVFIANESKAFAFSCFCVTDQINVDNFSTLRKDTNNVTFCQIIRQSSSKYPSWIFVLENGKKILLNKN